MCVSWEKKGKGREAGGRRESSIKEGIGGSETHEGKAV